LGPGLDVWAFCPALALELNVDPCTISHTDVLVGFAVLSTDRAIDLGALTWGLSHQAAATPASVIETHAVGRTLEKFDFCAGFGVLGDIDPVLVVALVVELAEGFEERVECHCVVDGLITGLHAAEFLSEVLVSLTIGEALTRDEVSEDIIFVAADSRALVGGAIGKPTAHVLANIGSLVAFLLDVTLSPVGNSDTFAFRQTGVGVVAPVHPAYRRQDVWAFTSRRANTAASIVAVKVLPGGATVEVDAFAAFLGRVRKILDIRCAGIWAVITACTGAFDVDPCASGCAGTAIRLAIFTADRIE
jgi:hypothetical protein